MTDQHPITPSDELVDLVDSRVEAAMKKQLSGLGYTREIAKKTLEWATPILRQQGADQELEACCKWLPKLPPWSANDLRRHRRPKPPSLKEQALAALDDAIMRGDCITTSDALPTLRRALEAIDD